MYLPMDAHGIYGIYGAVLYDCFTPQRAGHHQGGLAALAGQIHLGKFDDEKWTAGGVTSGDSRNKNGT